MISVKQDNGPAGGGEDRQGAEQSGKAEVGSASKALATDHAVAASEFSSLGDTTSTRSWVALSAVLVLLLAVLVFGIFGTLSIQKDVPTTLAGSGISGSGSAPAVVTATASGTVSSLSQTDSSYKKGAVLAQVRPLSGGASVPLLAETALILTQWSVIDGSPVSAGDAVALADTTGGTTSYGGTATTTTSSLAAISWLSADDVSTVKASKALSLQVNGKSYPVKVGNINNFQSSEAQIALLTGNPTQASQIINSTDGLAYQVSFEFTNSSDSQDSANSGSVDDVGTIVITEVEADPLTVLFGGGA